MHEKFRNPGRAPAPPTRLNWKILSLGYFDRQSKRYQVIENAKSVTPVVSGSEISYLQAFNGIDVKYTCANTRLKEEIVLSQTGRNNLPDPGQYGIARANAYLVFATEFALTPNNIRVFARADAGRVPVRQGNNFAFEGDDPIDFEDDDANPHFFFPKDYAWAVNDSATGFANQISVKRYFYSDRGKHYLLVGVPWGWVNSAPQGTLIIDPTTSVATSEDVWLEGTSNKNNHSAGLLVGKVAGGSKKRTIIKFNIAGSGIPTNAAVLNAQMKLYYYGTGGSGLTERWIQAHRILVNWNEAQATSVNRLTGTPWSVSYVGLNGIDADSSYESKLKIYLDGGGQQIYGWKNWDLSSLTQKWVNGSATNYGVVLWATNETTDGKDLRFHSSDANPPPNPWYPPVLEVTYSTQAKTVYFLKDHLGSIRATVQDSTGIPVRGYDDYDPWGYIMGGRSMASSILPSATRNRFTGNEFDDDFGLNWGYHDDRYYDHQIGRWMVRDPLAEKYPGWSPYVYALNNPVKFFDSDGKDVAFHGSANTNTNFQRALQLYNQTKLGASQMQRFMDDHRILVIYQVGEFKRAGGTIAGYTDWKIGTEQYDQVIIGSTDMGIKEQTYNNEGKVVITITLDKEILGKSAVEKNAETIYHEGKAHIEYDRDKGDLTGTAVDKETEHKLYGTDGRVPIKKRSPAEQFLKQAKKAKTEQEEREEEKRQ